jgi:PKD repeat protein
MPGTCFTLEDVHNGTFTDMRSVPSYSFTSSDTTVEPQFLIHIAKPFETETTNISCNGMNDGTVSFIGTGMAGAQFELTNILDSTEYNVTAAGDTVTFTGLPEGEYDVFSNFVGVCGALEMTVIIEEPVLVAANFTLNADTLILSNNDVLSVANTSTGTNYSWDFDDGSSSTSFNPTHTYVTPGLYQVMLTVDNDIIGACTQTDSKNVVVLSSPLAINEQLESSFSAFVSNENIVVNFDFENTTEITLNILDANGKRIVAQNYTVGDNNVLISHEGLAPGVYLINVITKTGSASKKLFIK